MKGVLLRVHHDGGAVGPGAALLDLTPALLDGLEARLAALRQLKEQFSDVFKLELLYGSVTVFEPNEEVEELFESPGPYHDEYVPLGDDMFALVEANIEAYEKGENYLRVETAYDVLYADQDFAGSGYLKHSPFGWSTPTIPLAELRRVLNEDGTPLDEQMLDTLLNHAAGDNDHEALGGGRD